MSVDVLNPNDSQEYNSHSEELIRISDPKSDLAFAAKAVEGKIFVEKKYVSTVEELAKEYEPYDSSSSFVAVINQGRVVGTTRIISNSPAGFKTINDAEAGKLHISDEAMVLFDSLDPSTIAEIGTISVEKEMRSRHEARVAVKLYGAILAHCKREGILQLIASMDGDYYESFAAIFGDTVIPMGEMVDYMGSPTIPLLMNPYDMHEYTRSTYPELYDQIEAASLSVV